MGTFLKNREHSLAFYQFYFEVIFVFQTSVQFLIESCVKDKATYLNVCKQTLLEILNCERSENYFKYNYKYITFNGISYRIIDYDIINQEISLHVQLTRLFTGLYSKIDTFSLDYFTVLERILGETEKNELIENCFLNILEPSLRTFIYKNQVDKNLSIETASIFLINSRQVLF
jgi:hypothetical protein